MMLLDWVAVLVDDSVGEIVGEIMEGLFTGELVGKGLSDGILTGVALAVGRTVRVGNGDCEATGGIAMNWSV